MNKFAILLSLACTTAEAMAEDASLEPARLREQTALNAIGPELLAAHLRHDGIGNAMVSSASLFYALSVLALGADGASETLLEERLLADADAALAEVAPQLATRLVTDGDGHGRQGAFRLNNSVWSTSGGSQGTPFIFSEDFVVAAERLYGAAHYVLDFTAPGASRTINDWADETTDGLIPAIIDDQLLATLDWAILNTAFFEGGWGTAMRRMDATDDYRFINLDGTAQAAETLRTLDYVASVVDLDDGSVAFQLPFAGGKYAFVLHVPAPDEADMPSWLLDDAVPHLADVASQVLAANGPQHQLSIRLPVFAFSDSVTLREGTPVTRALGLQPLFGARADLSRLSETPSRVDLIKQDTRIELDENGVRAAAATLIGGVRATTVRPTYPPRAIVVDRPFTFAIVERETQALIFNGVVVGVAVGE